MDYQKNLIEANDSISIKKLLQLYISKWYYFVIAITIGVLLAGFIIYTTPNKYTLHGTVLISEDKDPNISSANFLLDNSPLFKSKNNIKNEIGILTSKTLIESTIEELGFQIEYYKLGFLKKNLLYQTSPFIVEIDSSSHNIINEAFEVKILNKGSYEIKLELNRFILHSLNGDKEDIMISEPFLFLDTLRLGEASNHPYINFNLKKADSYIEENIIGNEYEFIIRDKTTLVNEYREKLNVSLIDQEASILEVEILGRSAEKEKDFLNKLFQTYLERDLNKKNRAAIRTIEFIDSQLAEVTESLEGAEKKLEDFRTKENFLDLDFAAKQSSEKLQELDKQEAQLLMNLKYYKYLLNYLESNDDINTIVAPSSIGIEDPLLNELIIKLQELTSKKVSLSFSVNDKNYELNRLNLEIKSVRNTLVENVKSIINSTEIQTNDLKSRINEVNAKLQKLPKNERSLVEIQRMFNLNDQLYNYLLEKRAEAGITKASNTPSNEILDEPSLEKFKPTEPKKGLILGISLILSFLFPVIIITTLEAFNDKITSEDQIEEMTKAAIVGKINKTHRNSPSISESLKSQTAESFRDLYTNLRFVLGNNKKVMAFTSTVSGEGKSYCAANLGVFLSKTGNNVILVECDLRKPGLKKNFTAFNKIGLSDYLIGNADFEQVLTNSEHDGLDIVFSGMIPPNPAELLSSSEFSNLISELAVSYDYVILDTAPLGIVSDYKMIANCVSQTLYVVRQGYSKQYFIKDLNKKINSGQLSQISLILNDVTRRESYKQYGKGYYYEEKKNGSAFGKIQKELLSSIDKNKD